MTPARYQELSNGHSEWLTDDELADGWHFCIDWDGMLIHVSDNAIEGCACGFRDRYIERKLNHGKAKLG